MHRYKVVLLNLAEKVSMFSTRPSEACAAQVEEVLNSMGQGGWELFEVVPVSNDGSPAQIRQAYHYFRKLE